MQNKLAEKLQTCSYIFFVVEDFCFGFSFVSLFFGFFGGVFWVFFWFVSLLFLLLLLLCEINYLVLSKDNFPNKTFTKFAQI